MQGLNDIFSVWPDISRMSAAVNEKHDTVYRWKTRKRIPEGAWTRVIAAAALQGKTLTVADMHAANRPPKVRAHKIKPTRRRRREEERAVS